MLKLNGSYPQDFHNLILALQCYSLRDLFNLSLIYLDFTIQLYNKKLTLKPLFNIVEVWVLKENCWTLMSVWYNDVQIGQ